MKIRSLVLLSFLFAVGGLLKSQSMAWQTVGAGTGMNGSVRSFYNDADQKLYAGGHFTRAKFFAANNILRWDSLGFDSLGAGCNTQVECFCVDSATNRIYFAGSFTSVDGQPAYGVAYISNNVLFPVPLPYALNGWITSMAMFNNELVIGGTFTNMGHCIVSWNGTSWSNHLQFPSTTYNGVDMLKVMNGVLYAGGGIHDFTQNFQGLAKWTGSSWTYVAVPMDLTGGVYDLEYYKGEMYACGVFTLGYNPNVIQNVAVLSGGVWKPVGTLFHFMDEVSDLQVYHGKLYMVNKGCMACGPPPRLSYVESWDGTNTARVGGGFSYELRCLEVHRDKLLAGGSMSICGTDSVHRLVELDTVSIKWKDLDGGLTGNYVSDMQSFNDSLYIGGLFTSTAGILVNHIAYWNDTDWYKMGEGTNGDVLAITKYHNTLIVGGTFNMAGGQSCNRIAAWNGTSWLPIGMGMDQSVSSVIDYNDTLVAGGYFLKADNQDAWYIAYYDVGGWMQMGSGFDAPVKALAMYNGVLYAGGMFSMADTNSVNYLAQWNGKDWVAVGNNDLDDEVNAMYVYNNELYLGGSFAITYKHAARWNGTSMQAMGNGINTGAVNAFTEYKNNLYVGGAFSYVNGSSLSSKKIASWNGTAWSSVYTGMSLSVLALANYGNALYAGGDFTNVSNKKMTYIAKGIIPCLDLFNVITNVSCYGGGDGSAYETITGTASPYTYAWSTGASTSAVSGLVAGNYTVTVTDSAGCSVTNGVTITQPLAITSTLTVTDATSCSANDGTIVPGISGGSMPYLYSWSNGKTTSAVSGLAQGTYTLTVTDVKGCALTVTASVSCLNDVTEMSSQNRIAIYPNPASSMFAIESEDMIDQFTLSNVLGEEVYRSEIKGLKFQVEISGQPNGICFLQLKTSRGVIYKKLVITH